MPFLSEHAYRLGCLEVCLLEVQCSALEAGSAVLGPESLAPMAVISRPHHQMPMRLTVTVEISDIMTCEEMKFYQA